MEVFITLDIFIPARVPNFLFLLPLLISSVLIDTFIVLWWGFFPLPFSSCVENIAAVISYFYAADQLIISLLITNVFVIYLTFFHGTKSMEGTDTASPALLYYHTFEMIHQALLQVSDSLI